MIFDLHILKDEGISMPKNKNKSKHLASVSLAIMGTGFIATIPFQHTFWGGLLQGGFEAGLVGGLADWFAVTALFRHPLGIPIPHTALLPKNRQRMSSGIVSMLENDWLTKESIRKKIKKINFTEKALSVLEEKMHTDAFKKAVVSLIVYGINKPDIEKITPLIENEVKSKIKSINTLSALQTALEEITTREYDVKAMDYALKGVETWAEKESTKYQLGTMAIEYIENMKMDGFMQLALRSFSNLINEDKLGNILQTFILKNVRNLQETENRNREKIILQIHTELNNTQNLEKLSEEISIWKDQFVTEWQPSNQITDLLKKYKNELISFVETPAFFENFFHPALNNLLVSTQADNEKMMMIENWIQKQITDIVEKNHSVIGRLTRENLDKLDDATITTMVENNVGKDLQWIRVNGALCGFLIGLFLFGIKAIF